MDSEEIRESKDDWVVHLDDEVRGKSDETAQTI